MHMFIEGMETFLIYIVEICTILMELFGIAVLVYTAIKCFIKWIKKDHDHLRLTLAECIALSLEFKIGSEVLLEVIEQIEDGTVESYPQPHIDAKVTRRIHKEEGKIVWEQSAKEIKSKILAYNPSPVAFALLRDDQVKIYRAVVADKSLETSEKPGTVLACSSPKKGVFVQCGSGVLELLEVQFPNSKVQRATDAMNGRKLSVGDRFVYDETVILKQPNILK